MKIAVIGSGISGLSVAYYLSKKYKVDLFEKDDHFGGHSFTYEIKEGDKIQIEKISKFGKIISIPLDIIEACGGGSARCMMAEIFLPKAIGNFNSFL